jgi:hypothetical protein
VPAALSSHTDLSYLKSSDSDTVIVDLSNGVYRELDATNGYPQPSLAEVEARDGSAYLDHKGHGLSFQEMKA